MISVIDLLLFLLVATFFLIVGLFRGKRASTELSYLVAERKTGLFALTCTLIMTEFNSGTLIAFSSMGYLAGYKAICLPGVFLVGLLFYAVTVAKKWKAYDGISVAGFFTQRYGRLFGKMASLCLMAAMVGFSATYVKSLTLIFAPIFSSHSGWMLSGILVGGVLVMTLRTGLVSIIRTDILSTLLMVIVFPSLIYFVCSLPQGLAVVEPTILPTRFLISLFVLTMFTYILAPWYGQKMFAARSQKIAYIAVILAAVFVFFLYGIACFATALLRKKGIEVAAAQEALPHLMRLALPQGVRGLFYALLFLSSATTLTGVWNALSGMLIHDFLSEKVQNNALRPISMTLGFAILSFLLANTLVDHVLDKMILANIPVAALSFSLLAGFYWKRVARFGAYLSTLVGLVVGVGAYLYFGEEGMYTWYWALWGIPLIFLAGISGSLLRKKNLAKAKA